MEYYNNNDDVSKYITNQEYIANKYFIKCFRIMMLVYCLIFSLNILGIFVIKQELMIKAFVPSLVIYFFVEIITRMVSLSDRWVKYFILFNVVVVFTITGVFITYHSVLTAILPFLYAALYSSKRVMLYVYSLTVISTVVIVYGGYYSGLCDANMTLLTTNQLSDYIVNGQFSLTAINSNPGFNLLLFFIIPRCLIYIAYIIKKYRERYDWSIEIFTILMHQRN